MSTPHIESKKNDFSSIVLMSGDPLRVKYIAKHYLQDSIKINSVRLMLAYTGFYKNKKISVMSHGIGMPSASLYVRELITEYGIKKIIRLGTCGTVQKNIQLRDIVVSMGASTDSKMNRINFQNNDFAALADFQMISNVLFVAKKMNIHINIGNFFTTDSFYKNNPKLLNILKKYNIIGIDMETSGIYSVSAEFRVPALSICTVSDHLINNTKISSKDRELTFNEMIQIALESVLIDF